MQVVTKLHASRFLWIVLSISHVVVFFSGRRFHVAGPIILPSYHYQPSNWYVTGNPPPVSDFDIPQRQRIDTQSCLLYAAIREAPKAGEKPPASKPKGELGAASTRGLALGRLCGHQAAEGGCNMCSVLQVLVHHPPPMFFVCSFGSCWANVAPRGCPARSTSTTGMAGMDLPSRDGGSGRLGLCFRG